MFLAQSAGQLRDFVLSELRMEAHSTSRFALHKNADGGFLRRYGSEGLFEFTVADYVVDHDFCARFECAEDILRFGTMYEGRTYVQLDGSAPSGSLPSVFVTLERDVSGTQEWVKGQHLHGAEFSLFPAFYEPLLSSLTGMGDSPLDSLLEPNRSYKFMPLDMVTVLERVVRADEQGELNALLVQAAAIECLGILTELKRGDKGNLFKQSHSPTKAWVGEDLPVAFTQDDMRLIESAHCILEQSYVHPPTIESLSLQLGINQQKLKVGFSRRYRTTIGQFTLLLRMNQAALMLRTTEEPVGTIARYLGYANTSNFIKAFRRTYSCSPGDYRVEQGSALRTSR